MTDLVKKPQHEDPEDFQIDLEPRFGFLALPAAHKMINFKALILLKLFDDLDDFERHLCGLIHVNRLIEVVKVSEETFPKFY